MAARPAEDEAVRDHRAPASLAQERSRPRQLAWRCYALQAAGLVLYIIPIWLQVYIDTRRAGEVAIDACSESHRHWRVRSTLLFLIWSILGGFTLAFGIGWPILIAAFVWYAWRIAYGAWRLRRGMPVGRPVQTASS